MVLAPDMIPTHASKVFLTIHVYMCVLTVLSRHNRK